MRAVTRGTDADNCGVVYIDDIVNQSNRIFYIDRNGVSIFLLQWKYCFYCSNSYIQKNSLGQLIFLCMGNCHSKMVVHIIKKFSSTSWKFCALIEKRLQIFLHIIWHKSWFSSSSSFVVDIRYQYDQDRRRRGEAYTDMLHSLKRMNASRFFFIFFAIYDLFLWHRLSLYRLRTWSMAGIQIEK